MPRLCTHVCLLTLSAFALAACGRSDRPDTHHSFRTMVEDGVSVAVNEGGPRYREELFDYELQLTLQEDEREESLLFNPSAFLMGDDGRFYVADSGNDRIAVFDEQGRYHHAIGRRGSGPGEFRAFRLEEVREGVVTTFDLLNGTLCRFTTEGRLLDSHSLSGDQMRATTIGSCRRLSGDRFLMVVTDVNLQDFQNLENFALRLLLKEAGGDTLWTVRTPEVKVMEHVQVTIMGTSLPFPLPIPFGPAPAAKIAPDGSIVVSPGLTPELEVYTPGEGLSRRIRLGLPLEPPSEADRRSLEEGLRRTLANSTGPADDAIRQITQAQLENLHYPEFKAPWGSLHVDENGAIWLETITGSAFAEQADTTLVFHVVSPEGEYLGLTTTPKAGWVTPSRGRLLLRRSDPESGEVSLEVYAIRPRPAGLVYP
jgi:hypothetical protein